MRNFADYSFPLRADFMSIALDAREVVAASFIIAISIVAAIAIRLKWRHYKRIRDRKR
jgi:hypothetical protein